ncbi:MAG: cupin-like domain-containing protein, partial [bacterium]|nr:cupin-like domain-containing protein [bacterium]
MTWKAGRIGKDSAPLPEEPAFKVKGNIGRVDDPPAKAFQKRYLEKNRPVVINYAMDNWRARDLWDDDYLKSVMGDHRGEVMISTNGLFPDYITKPEPMTKMEMPFSEFLDRVAGRGGYKPVLAEGEGYYIYGKPYLFESSPQLKEDVPKPGFLEGADITSVNMWFSTGGSITPLHYDLINNLQCQVRGRKRVYLFDPAQFDCLYFRSSSFPGLDNYARQSQVDIHYPDLKAFPKFKEAEVYVITLEPGDMLLIASNWPHEVETLE